LSGKADSGEAADEVFTEGEQGDVASTALQSPLDEAAVEAVEAPKAPKAVEAADGAGADGDAGEGQEPSPAADATDEQASPDTADASADTAVS